MAHATGKGKQPKLKTVGWSYVGGGDFLPSIPARDLSIDEYKQHKAEIEANKKATGRPLYVPLTEAVEEEGEE